MKIFEKGQEYADQAIAADPQNNLGYYWKSSNIGRWGQVKGILNSLFKAGPMRDLLLKDLSLDALLKYRMIVMPRPVCMVFPTAVS